MLKTNKGFSAIGIVLVIVAILVVVVYLNNNLDASKQNNQKPQVNQMHDDTTVTSNKDIYNRYVAKECKIFDGCNGPIICDDVNAQIGGSTCEASPQYACYKVSSARCEKQADNHCGWTQTTSLQACISTAHF